MSSANRVRLTHVREVIPGVTPNTPKMRTARMTGESLVFSPEYVDSAEIRSDRMMSDPVRAMQSSSGGINFEFSHPENNTPLSDDIASAMQNAWSVNPERDNGGVADSVITGVTGASRTFVVTTGAAFAVGALVRSSGFTNSANNVVFKADAGTNATTVIAVAGTALVDEVAPPATARLKQVGFQANAGDITATASGLSSTSLDFTAFGLSVGQFIKIGGIAAGNRFATDGNNTFVRITAISANALTCDHLPSGWAVDAGAGKTISVFVSDIIKNGVTPLSMTKERGFMDLSVPAYIVNTGMQVDQMQVTLANKQVIKGSFQYKGMGGSVGTTTLSASPEPEPTFPVMQSNSNTMRLVENGVTMTGPNWVAGLDFTINNNLRMIEAVDQTSPVGIVAGECSVTGKAETYLGDTALLTKFYNGTATSFSNVIQKEGTAFVFHFPRVILRDGGNPSASSKNTDVMASFNWQASKDTLTQAHVVFCRFGYVE